MAYIKINVSADKKAGNFILGELKSLAFNSKTAFTLENTGNGIQFSKITGELNGRKFIMTPVDSKSTNAYNIKIGNYEVDITKSYNGVGLIEEKFTKVIDGIHDRIREEYMFDENSGKYLPRPKQPNFFQRLFAGRGK